MDRITAAALARLGDGTFDEVAVATLAREAGVIVGGFYARFSGKEAVLEYLNLAVLGGVLARARGALSPEQSAGLGAREVIRSFVDLSVRSFREHREVFQQISLRSRTSRDHDFRARVQAANREVHDLFRARLTERIAESAHLAPAAAVDVALTAVSGAMREYVLFTEFRPQFEPLEDERLVDELTDLFCSYLRIEA
ncbi:MAG: TetR/AcrR family transcriptional regulator [Planctomycetota bacterium]|nr:TetR/AcrR family transcriptional regulator [Planctomycetota bacterium]